VGKTEIGDSGGHSFIYGRGFQQRTTCEITGFYPATRTLFQFLNSSHSFECFAFGGKKLANFRLIILESAPTFSKGMAMNINATKKITAIMDIFFVSSSLTPLKN
jgi:hypothetical protein